MKNYIKAVTLLSLGAATLFGAGYKIPEQSLNAVALSAANVAGANGADASYYNPANMAFSQSGSEIEMGLTYIKLPSINYTDKLKPEYSGNSEVENFYIPTFHYMSPEVNNWRFGLSFVAPGGLSKRWNNKLAKSSAQEFTLKIMELNPTLSYKVNDKFALGFGLRGVYTDGVVKSDANDAGTNLVRDLKGDSIDFGYNLALSYKPIEDMTLSATYRSKVDLTVDGTAHLVSPTTKTYDGKADVSIPLPATLDLAAAYTFDKTTVELVYERVYWSSYKNLDFNYDGTITDVYLIGAFDNPIAKNWKDTDTYRIGITHQYSDKLKLMAGFAIDKNPVPSETLGFELPDSDAKLYSLGFEYKISDRASMGLAYLYDQKKSRTVKNRTASKTSAPYGEFKDASAQIAMVSMKYRF